MSAKPLRYGYLVVGDTVTLRPVGNAALLGYTERTGTVIRRGRSNIGVSAPGERKTLTMSMKHGYEVSDDLRTGWWRIWSEADQVRVDNLAALDAAGFAPKGYSERYDIPDDLIARLAAAIGGSDDG